MENTLKNPFTENQNDTDEQPNSTKPQKPKRKYTKKTIEINTTNNAKNENVAKQLRSLANTCKAIRQSPRNFNTLCVFINQTLVSVADILEKKDDQ